MRTLESLQPGLDVTRNEEILPRAVVERAFDTVYTKHQSEGSSGKQDVLSKKPVNDSKEAALSKVLQEAEAVFKANKERIDRAGAAKIRVEQLSCDSSFEKPPLSPSMPQKAVLATLASETLDDEGEEEKNVEELFPYHDVAEERGEEDNIIDRETGLARGYSPGLNANGEGSSPVLVQDSESSVGETSLDDLTNVTDNDESDRLLQELEDFHLSSSDESEPAECAAVEANISHALETTESFNSAQAIVLEHSSTDDASVQPQAEAGNTADKEASNGNEYFAQMVEQLEQTYTPRVIKSHDSLKCLPASKRTRTLEREKSVREKAKISKASLTHQLKRERRKVKILKSLLADSRQENSYLKLKVSALLWEINRIRGQRG